MKNQSRNKSAEYIYDLSLRKPIFFTLVSKINRILISKDLPLSIMLKGRSFQGLRL
ncbi:hypothetical protein Hanom_Chr11g01032901 [Helianthus anomalus]